MSILVVKVTNGSDTLVYESNIVGHALELTNQH